jgi:hypothetical protein
MDYKTHTGQSPFRLDANESAFFLRQIEHIKSKTYDVKYKELKAFALIPISNEAPSGTPEITWRQYGAVGLAKVIQDYAKDWPRIDVYGTESTSKVKGIGASYGYSIVDIRRAQIAGLPLDQKKANMARRAVEQKINTIALLGLDSHNIKGLVNYPGVTEYTVLADGSGASKLWSSKTPDQIVRDLAGLVAAVVTPTNGVEVPDTLLLPLDKYQYIANTRMGLPSDKTILSFFLDNQKAAGMINYIGWLTELTGAGVGGLDRYMCYKRDEDHLTLEIPQPFEQFDADKQGAEYVIPVHAETAGIIVYYPLAMAWGDGI